MTILLTSNHYTVKLMAVDELFGWLASILTTLIFAPQLVKAFKTKMTNDISMLMLILAVLGNLSWLIHALLTNNWPLIVCAFLIIIMSIVLIAYKYNNEKSRVVSK
ncbi:MAG: SemiSWEET family transporter [Gammaproteobacteria bacterium]|nr:SemiSWEET family transporter [Gammaproteobacteria bacterium]MDH5735539.1 SemiSWEET family transporter [Gammaproteobacteria bacterium]